tara:strand:- start:586 stop:1512 length:927 start_codon:yes stop_codon:yes gene_type:complete
MKKNILISGAAGFVGTNLYYGLKNKYNLTLIDNFSSTKNIWLKKTFIKKLDISSSKDLKKYLSRKKFFAIIHTAALFANQKSIDQPLEDLKSNVVGTLNLLEYAKKNKTKMINYSSSCVYSSSKTDEKIYQPSSQTPYAISKFSGEQYCSFYSEFYNLNIINLRLFNIFGEYDYNGPYRSVIPNFINNANDNKKIVLFNNGNDSRDFTYVQDLVKATILLLEKKRLRGTFNFGFNQPIKIKKVANIIKTLFHSKSKIVLVKQTRKWDKTRTRKAKNTKLKKILPNFKFTKFEKAILKTSNWYKNNLLL